MRSVSEHAFTNQQAEDARAITACVARSAALLRTHGREPVRVRMNPLDAEVIVANQWPDSTKQRLLRVLGLQVVLDEDTRLGWPVAEFDPEALLVAWAKVRLWDMRRARGLS